MLKRADSVFESWEAKGDWWVPGTPAKRVRGKLSVCDATGYSLEIDDSLGVSNDSPNMIVLGERADGTPITLMLCTLQSGTNDGKFHGEKYSAEWLLVGKHYDSIDSITLLSVGFGIANLEEWHNVKAFETIKCDAGNQILLKYVSPGYILLFEDECMKISLGYGVQWEEQWKEQSPAQKEASIRHSAGINICGRSKLPLDSCAKMHEVPLYETICNITAFFTLATSEPLYYYDVKGHLTHDSADPDFLKPLEIHHLESVTALKRPVLNENMVFRWDDIASEPQKYFSAWLSNIKKTQFPFWLYSQTLNENLSLKQKFIYLTQALEGYHRCKFGKEPDEAHTRKVASIVDACPHDEREWLQGKLEHSHEPSLRTRLRELCRQYEEAFIFVAGTNSKLNKHIGAIVDIRNANAHCLNENALGTVFSSCQGYALVKLMQFAMTLNFLGDAGFSKEQVISIAQRRNTKFAILKQLLTDPE